MTGAVVSIAGERFRAAWQESAAPETCALLRRLLPFENRLVHARWSGEACWVPLGEAGWSLRPESATSFPAPGDILIYPGGKSEAELLIAYGPARFASKAGQLAGNPVLRIFDRLDRLAEVGREVLWKGAAELRIAEGG